MLPERAWRSAVARVVGKVSGGLAALLPWPSSARVSMLRYCSKCRGILKGYYQQELEDKQ